MSTPPDHDKHAGLPGTSTQSGTAQQQQQQQIDYKARLDKAADEAREKSQKSRRDTIKADQPEGVVSKLVDQVTHVLPESGKKILGLSDGDSDKAAAANTENAQANGKDIPSAAVKEFIRDAHRSQVANFQDQR